MCSKDAKTIVQKYNGPAAGKSYNPFNDYAQRADSAILDLYRIVKDAVKTGTIDEDTGRKMSILALTAQQSLNRMIKNR